MPRQPTTGLHPNDAGLEVEFVVHDDDPLRIGEAEPLHQRGSGAARLVHERERHGEHDPGLPDATLGDRRIVLAGAHAVAEPSGQQAHRVLPDVVAGVLVPAARISETEDEPVEAAAAPTVTTPAEHRVSSSSRRVARDHSASSAGSSSEEASSPEPSPSSPSPSPSSSEASSSSSAAVRRIVTVTTGWSSSWAKTHPAGTGS